MNGIYVAPYPSVKNFSGNVICSIEGSKVFQMKNAFYYMSLGRQYSWWKTITGRESVSTM